MIGKIFNSIRNSNGLSAIRANDVKATVMIVYRSPYASLQDNIWLEQQLIRLYTKYYIRVNWSTTGRFWKNTEPAIKVSYGDEEKEGF